MTKHVEESGYDKWEKAESALKSLEALNKAPSANFRNEYRLLSPTPMYLVASHYNEGWGWSIMTKWGMFEVFDKALQSGKNESKITQSVSCAIQDQRNIVLLTKLKAVLADPTKTTIAKADAYRGLEKSNSALFKQIKDCIFEAAKGTPAFNATIENEPDDPLHQAVIKKMIWILEEGYVDCNKHLSFFDNLLSDRKN
ncbi:MAG: hypothetical protein ABSA17_01100 [Rhabdochlamydiaceae bacterium]|jgi:hypothetical protein